MVSLAALGSDEDVAKTADQTMKFVSDLAALVGLRLAASSLKTKFIALLADLTFRPSSNETVII